MATRAPIVAGFALSTLLCQSVATLAAPSLDGAKDLFKTYQRLGNTFNVSLCDLYTDDALIQSTRYYANGQTKTITMTGAQYKPLIAQAMPAAKAANDKDTYKSVSFVIEGERVRVKAMRHNLRKNYDSWLVLLVEKRGKEWKIVQEQSQTRP